MEMTTTTKPRSAAKMVTDSTAKGIISLTNNPAWLRLLSDRATLGLR
jgi:hypothetical protein